MESHSLPPDGVLPFSDVTGLLAAAASAEKQQALVARIFLPQPVAPTNSASIDQFVPLSNIAKQLQQFFQEYTRSSDYLDGYDYIWHRESPSISVICPPSPSHPSTSKSSTQPPPHILLHLRTGGDCIEDEWLATHLLVRASTHFAQHQLCISVEDEDGQFLLIEAADYLPEWVTPEAVTNRVWIFEGHLHVIPPHYKSSDDGSLAPARAVELVTDNTILTRATDEIEAAAFSRAYEFPSAAMLHHHRTLAYIPRRVAQVLAADPQLISNCVASIQSRDIVSSRSGSRLVHFPPPSRPSSNRTVEEASTTTNDNHIVLTPIRMTRHLYAQLLYDRFFPPRQLGPQWQAAVEKYRARLYHQHNTSSTQAKIEDEAQVQAEMQQGRWHDLGAKIWCGLEMAYTESLARRARTKARPMAAGGAGISAQERERRIGSLIKLGYFQDEIEGSAKWKQLEAEATFHYTQGAISSFGGSKKTEDEVLLCEKVDRILQHESTTSSSLKVIPPDATLETLQAAEDDELWLQLQPDDIDSILQSKTGTTEAGGHAVNEQGAFQRLGAFNSKMEDFIKTKSDVQGALFEDELKPDDMLLDDDDLLFEDLDEEEYEQRIQSEVKARMQTNGEDEKRKLVERLIPHMSEQEWTRKPDFGANSGLGGNISTHGGENFVSTIDRTAAELNAGPTEQTEGGKEVATRGDNNLSAAHDELRRRLTSQYMVETSSLLSSQGHERYDGASDSDDDELEQETSPEIRRQRAAEFDLEPDEDETGQEDQDAGWEDVGDLEALDEETEVGNLLEFARISLGLTKEQYQEILEDREKKGKFVPSKPKTASASSKPVDPPKLDTFESVMAAMESQLYHLKSSQAPAPTTQSTSTRKGASQDQVEDEDEELLAHLLKSNSDLPASLLSHLGQGSQATQLEAFLRSFQAQSTTSGPHSGSGPVEVLMRRFGLGALPADQDSHSQQ